MKISALKWFALTVALAAGTCLAPAAEPTLKIGDPAPKMQTGAWIQGEPVTNFEKGKAYLLEFWCTWGTPCLKAIPTMNGTYLKYKDKGLVVIGQDCVEHDEMLVAPFIKQRGDQMAYRVALDDKTDGGRGKMVNAWLIAAGLNGIPTAFLIDTKGVLVWLGPPMSLKDETIDAVLAGKFDTQKAADEAAELRKNKAQLEKLSGELQTAMQAKDWDTAAVKADELSKLIPIDRQDRLPAIRLNIALGQKNYPMFYKLVQQISEAHKDDAQIQNALAWEIVTDPAIEQRDLALATTFAKRANDAAGGKEPGILDTYARVLFMAGKKDEAIAMETKALGIAGDNQKASFQARLESYREGQLPKLSQPGAP